MLNIYYHITAASASVLERILQKRLDKGKEDPARIQEKKAIISKNRPPGALLWLHAASIGEAQSALILMDKCLEKHPKDLSILLTTGTLSSARLMEKRLPANTFHQFAPLDHPLWVETFLDHWEPDFVLWMESELWPNMLAAIKKRFIPAMLVNARLSSRSFKLWSCVKPLAQTVLSTFDKILCQTPEDQDFFNRLGAPQTIVTNNIKYSAKPLTFDKEEFKRLHECTATRPIWLLASSHNGEEDMACRIHEIVKRHIPELLTIIVPRHPERRVDIAQQCAAYNLKITWRGEHKALPDDDDDLYIADTFGELGLFYRLAPIACIGRSFSNDGGGGHNPIEPAQLGCAILHGPHVQNLQDIYNDMDTSGAALYMSHESMLTGTILDLLNDKAKRESLQNKALKFSKEKAGAIDRAMEEITPALHKIILTRSISDTPKQEAHNAAQNT